MKKVAVFGAIVACSVSSGALAQELRYPLPKVAATAGWKLQLTGCPKAGVEYDPQAYISGEALTGVKPTKDGVEFVRLKPSSPFLGSRKVALTFHENGLLKTINAEGSGQGGTVLASVLKTVAGIATLGTAAAPALVKDNQDGTVQTPLAFHCKAAVQKKIDRWSAVSQRIDQIEADVAAGVALGATRTAVYEKLKVEKVELQKELTLVSAAAPKFDRKKILETFFTKQGDKYKLNTAVKKYEKKHALKPLDLSKWFEPKGSLPTQDVGENGFCARFTITRAAFLSSMPYKSRGYLGWKKVYVDDKGKLEQSKRFDRFVYLMPVPVTAELFKRGGINPKTQKPDDCTAIAGKALGSGTLMVPQLSGYYILPIGSGMFESKSVSAEFSETGAVMSIGAGGTGGGAQLGELMAGTLAAAETIRDGKTASIQRRVERMQAENDLEELLKASKDSDETAAQDDAGD